MELTAAAKRAAIERAKLQPKEVRLAELNEKILSWHAKDKPECESVDEGARYDVLVSKQEIRRTIVMPNSELSHVLTPGKFMNIFAPTLAVLKKELTPEQYKAAVREDRSGPRTLQVVMKGTK